MTVDTPRVRDWGLARVAPLALLGALALLATALGGCEDERRSVQLPLGDGSGVAAPAAESEAPGDPIAQLGEPCDCDSTLTLPENEAAALPLSDRPRGTCRCANNSAGQLAMIVWDRDGNGVFDGRYDYLYHPTGLLASLAYGRDPSGGINWRLQLRYDNDGRLTDLSFDADGDGYANRGRRNHYDNQGRLVLVESDRDGDGHADRRREQEYDSRGRVSLVEIDTNVDGRPERRRWLHYDDADREVRVSQDNDGDGVVDDEAHYHYDAEGRRTHVEMRRAGVSHPRQACVPPCPPPYEGCRCGTLGDL